MAKKNWTFMEITANLWKTKFFDPNDETHFDILIGWIPRPHTECPASLLNNWAQATWALRVRPGDSSDQKIEMGFIIRDGKLSFSEICSNFHDIVATPNVYVFKAIRTQIHFQIVLTHNNTILDYIPKIFTLSYGCTSKWLIFDLLFMNPFWVWEVGDFFHL